MVIENPIEKVCFNHCPNCGATDPDIEWGDKEWYDNACAQDAECQKCGCYFKEYYGYSSTEFEVGVVPRIPCKYPMSDFYTWEDQVGFGDKVSTPEDCEKCSGGCENKHCLIQTSASGFLPPEDRTKIPRVNTD